MDLNLHHDASYKMQFYAMGLRPDGITPLVPKHFPILPDGNDGKLRLAAFFQSEGVITEIELAEVVCHILG
jgi:hypothetical protein